MKKRKKKATRRRPQRTEVACPFCGETDELFVDLGGGDAQSYVEDCAVCCRPRIVHIEASEEPGVPNVWVERGD